MNEAQRTLLAREQIAPYPAPHEGSRARKAESIAMEFASRIDGRPVPRGTLSNSTRQADHHLAIKARPPDEKALLATAAGSPAGNPSGCTVPSSALRTTRITTRFLVAQAPAGPINPGVSDTVDALGSDANMQIDIEQVLKTVRARLEVMMRMRILKCKEPKRCREDFGKPLDERIRGMSIPELSDLCGRGSVFDQECCKAAALGISRHKMLVESAQVGLPAQLALSALRAAPQFSRPCPSASRAQRFLDALPRPQAEPEPHDVEGVLDMWRCMREDEPMLEHTEELPEMGGQLDALEMLEMPTPAPAPPLSPVELVALTTRDLATGRADGGANAGSPDLDATPSMLVCSLGDSLKTLPSSLGPANTLVDACLLPPDEAGAGSVVLEDEEGAPERVARTEAQMGKHRVHCVGSQFVSVQLPAAKPAVSDGNEAPPLGQIHMLATTLQVTDCV